MRIFLDKIIFLFSLPKYKIYQRVWLWDKCYMIIGIYREWAVCRYCYKLLGSFAPDVSEGLIDFYVELNKN